MSAALLLLALAVLGSYFGPSWIDRSGMPVLAAIVRIVFVIAAVGALIVTASCATVRYRARRSVDGKEDLFLALNRSRSERSLSESGAPSSPVRFKALRQLLGAPPLAVGDWVIGDMPVRRGEYIGRMEQAEVPVWFETRERFDLAKPPPPPRINNPLLRPPPPPKGIPVDFTTTELLVDWEGGRYYQPIRTGEKTFRDVREDSNVEMLVLGADGKVRVHNSRLDSKDKDREAQRTPQSAS